MTIQRPSIKFMNHLTFKENNKKKGMSKMQVEVKHERQD